MAGYSSRHPPPQNGHKHRFQNSRWPCMSFTGLYTLSDLISNPAELVKTEVLGVISRGNWRVSDDPRLILSTT